MNEADVAIVGAGAVGLSVAANIARADRVVVVLETNPRHGMEASSRNSEVVHAGLYYPAKSLKAELCHEGRRRLYALAGEGRFFARKTGKLVVASSVNEIPALERLKAKAAEAGAEGLALLDGKETRDRVPGLKAEAALWSPESGILDTEGLLAYYHGLASAGGAILQPNMRVLRAEKTGGAWRLELSSGESLSARVVVNAAGLYSDKVSAMAGLTAYRLHWCKGTYFRLKRPLALPHLVYPLPTAHGLGVHLTLDRRGGVRLGPDAEFVDTLDYSIDDRKRESFHRTVSQYLDGVRPEDLDPDTAGIRAKLSGPEGGFKDFVIADETAKGLPGWINCVGIDSPGITASPAIGELVGRLVKAQLQAV